MKYTLVNYNSNWADEIDIEGFVVMPSEEWNDIKLFLSKYKVEFEYYVGTNEEIYYADGIEILADYSTKSITEEEYKTLENLKLKRLGFIGPIESLEYMVEKVTPNPDYKIPLYDVPKIVRVSYKDRDYKDDIENLIKRGFVKTYQGKTGETWEL